MDKILSARVDESIIRRIGILAQRLNKSKKAIIEGAIRMYAQKNEDEKNIDPLEQTLGAWHRVESPDKTVKKTRKVFQASMQRRKK